MSSFNPMDPGAWASLGEAWKISKGTEPNQMDLMGWMMSQSQSQAGMGGGMGGQGQGMATGGSSMNMNMGGGGGWGQGGY
jgi:hypothetical protein